MRTYLTLVFSLALLLGVGLTANAQTNERGRVIRLNDNPGVYLVTQEGTKHGVGSLDALRALGFSLNDVTSVNTNTFNSYPTGFFITTNNIPPTPGTNANLVRLADNPRVYGVAPNGTKRWFRFPAVLQSYGFSFSQVRSVSPPALTQIPNTKAIRLQGQPGVYRLNPDWTKQGISSPQVLQSLGLSFRDVVVVNQTEFQSYPTGKFLASADQPSPSKTYRSDALDFSIRFPANMSANRTQTDTVRFRLSGPSQSSGTEVTDGILLTIRREPIPEGSSLRDYAQDQTVDQPMTEAIIRPVTSTSINGIPGYTATIRTLGEVTHIFLPGVVNSAYHITYVNPDPNNRGYQQIFDQMLASFSRL